MSSFKYLKELRNLPLANEHHICGLIYGEFNDVAFLGEYRKQLLRNTLVIEELSELSEHFPELCGKLVLLKGASLLNDIYNDVGYRFMSDVDILCLEGFLEIEEVLVGRGFKKNIKLNWYGDAHKSEWTRVINGIEINIELHRKLFFHVEDPSYETTDSRIGNFKKFEKELNLIHLIGHAGFQHTFQNLYWIFDIYYFCQKYDDSLDMGKIKEYLNHFKLNNCFEKTLYILDRYFSYSYPGFKSFKKKSLTNFLLNKEIILSPHQGGLRYYLLKHLLKDSLLEAFKYDFLWLWLKIRVKLGRNT